MSLVDSLTTGVQVGAVLPLFTAIVQRPSWSPQVKKIIAAVLAIVAGVVTVAATGGWEQFEHAEFAFATVIAVLTVSQSTYDLLWKPTRIAPWIERSTAPALRDTSE
ncbi:hypothetical protein ACIQCR_17180 [Streptomyces sp. NPDC093249]|uniref:hypothetical protein n=1 Tax=unclassified Streptomyces TaxID=2593676 RepID=UPI00380A53E4